jgi:hypothetical protein
VRDLAVGGTAIWNRTNLELEASLQLSGVVGGDLAVRFATDVPRGGVVAVSGRLDGRRVDLRLPAPWSPQG